MITCCLWYCLNILLEFLSVFNDFFKIKEVKQYAKISGEIKIKYVTTLLSKQVINT